MAAFILQPNVAEFVDVVMRERRPLEFRLGEVTVATTSALVGRSLRDVPGGGEVLALRHPSGADFTTNPPSTTPIEAGDVLVAVGTDDELAALTAAAGHVDASPDRHR